MTLSFNHIGNLGHLGNQMFQYAAVKGLSRRHGSDFVIAPTDAFGSNYPTLRSTIDECFDIKCERSLTSFPTYNERFFEFDEEFFNNPPKLNLDLFGYFQSEKYFNHIEDEIRSDFTFIPDIYEPTKETFNLIVGDDKVVSLHIRRTDYTTSSDHQLQNIEYYQKALEYFEKELPVLIFSDDPEWCKEQKIFSNDRFLISESENCYVDLCLMSLCNYHIIANSSFSWWGSWLAKSEKTVAPQNWFGGGCINHNTQDLYCSDWIII